MIKDNIYSNSRCRSISKLLLIVTFILIAHSLCVPLLDIDAW